MGLLLGDVLSIEDVDKLRLLLGLGLRQAFQELIQFSVSTEKLVLRQGQIIPPLDGEAAEIGVTGGVGNLRWWSPG